MVSTFNIQVYAAVVVLLPCNSKMQIFLLTQNPLINPFVVSTYVFYIWAFAVVFSLGGARRSFFDSFLPGVRDRDDDANVQ